MVTTKLSAEETGGALGITHFSAVLGERAPRHMHTLEDEIFIIEGGEVRLTVGDRTETVEGAGVLFLPRGIVPAIDRLRPRPKVAASDQPG